MKTKATNLFPKITCLLVCGAAFLAVPLTAPGIFSTHDQPVVKPVLASLNLHAGLAQGGDGSFYGTKDNDGSKLHGSVFHITPDGMRTTLYSFTGGSDGSSPNGGLVMGKDGNFYGTTMNGGANGEGTVFRITPNGTLTTIYSFSANTDDCDSAGANPKTGLVLGSDGNFYGTTQSGGANGWGTMFEIASNGTLATLYSFSVSDGEHPTELITGTNLDGVIIRDSGVWRIQSLEHRVPDHGGWSAELALFVHGWQ